MARPLHRITSIGAIAALGLACVAPAHAADAGSALRAKILAAMAATSSFQIDIANPQGITGNAVVEPRLGQTKVQGSGGPHTLVLYAIGGYVYQRYDAGAWERRKLPVPVGAFVAPIAGATVSPQADTFDAGTTYGAFTAVTTFPIPGVGSIPNVSMTCTYDKATSLLHACTSLYANFSFHAYNDPKNTIALPDAAKNAPEAAPYGPLGFPGA